MAAPTSTYVDYGAGNDYKGATFTDGAYTSATKTLVKASAFAASQVNHWLYLESNDGGSIVAGYYKIATVTDANTVILATDAGAGVDDDAAKCTQADGTTTKPWRSIQGALDLITRDATNGDQVNVKAGTAQVNQAALTLARYGTPTYAIPLIIRGCTTTAGDGGIGEIDCNGATMFASTYTLQLSELKIHNGGNNHLITTGTNSYIYRCEVYKGASSPSSKRLINVDAACRVVGCYVHDAGTTGYGIYSGTFAKYNYVKDCPYGVTGTTVIEHNTIIDCVNYGVSAANQSQVMNNSIYVSSAATGTGIDAAGSNGVMIVNNIIEGYSGIGGKGINATGDIFMLGYNAFYNNATQKSTVDVYIDLSAFDVTLSASPFTNPGSGDFSLKTSVSGAIDGAFPGAWYGPASTTDHADIGAVQNGAGAAAGISMPRVRIGH